MRAIDLFCKQNKCSVDALDKYVKELAEIIIIRNTGTANYKKHNESTDLIKAHEIMKGERT